MDKSTCAKIGGKWRNGSCVLPAGSKITGRKKEMPIDTKQSIESRELEIHIMNNQRLYNNLIYRYRNLTRKKHKGTYDPKLAPKMFLILADEAAKDYAKTYGGHSRMFSKEDRIQTAVELTNDFEEAYRNKEYDFMEKKKKPKKRKK